MRIISGKFKGRRFNPPSKMPARPTTDVAKEGLFNVLQNYVDFDGAKTLDLYGGTGSITYELLSRGIDHGTIVERSPKMTRFIKSNLEKLGEEDHVRICQDDVFTFLNYDDHQYDFIFAGPPYADKKIDKIPVKVMDKDFLTEEGIFVLEHTPRNNYEDYPGFFRSVNYGTTIFSFFKK